MTIPTNLHQSVAQIIEWTYGRTHIEFGVVDISFSKNDNLNSYSFHITTNTARLDKIKHPLGLVVESIQLSLTGTCISLVDLGHNDKDIISSCELEDLTEFNLTSDQSRYSTVNVQNMLGLCDGGMKSISRHFLFRSNLMHAIR